MSNFNVEKFGYKQELSRKLNLWQLTAFGVNYMIPLAPAIIFGMIASSSGGSVALPYLLGFLAMLLTANAYVFMVRKFPLSGSVYTYVGKSMGKKMGFLAGWILLLDYILIPTVTSVSAVLYFQNYFPNIPFSVLLIGFALVTGLINLFGVKLLANLGLGLLLVGEVVLVISFITWGHAATVKAGSWHGLFSALPFHISSVSALFTATSLAVLSYLGFDAITTLSEEAKNPIRDIPRAIFLSICIGALTMFLCGYLGILAASHLSTHLADPTWQNTALFFITKEAGGNIVSIIFTSGFILSMFVFNVVATTAGSRLLYAMGRDNVLPKAIFGQVNKRFKTPHFNIFIIIVVECVVGLLVPLNTIGEMVNFGALVGFILLNISVIYFSMKDIHNIKTRLIGLWLKQFILPICAVCILASILFSMSSISLMVGLSWLVMGVIYYYQRAISSKNANLSFK
ncbi:APC family permease [Fangia hongkongensis]|uniref:APC family permease n=1 Tax=Fangia hongkongensis TaxID=270495 RepID=UPI00037D8C4A|nr:amino acid permease [Fangia hongkongensis]MBK2125296.1 amino acid permease [Fangia hongkongensis]